AKVRIAGGIGARKDFAEKHPDLVVAWLGIYMCIIEGMKANPEQYVKPLLEYFNGYCGLELTEEQVRMEFKYRPLYSVSEQVNAHEDPAKLATWMSG
ncbi:aliphatic sulfonate ABC transporter, partial [Desulfovibrio desulfuricans]|nr:aliphatic sulfonate ABC transporter [Desulfovibrio desulfuricans]